VLICRCAAATPALTTSTPLHLPHTSTHSPLHRLIVPADLDHHNPELRESLVDWLNWLAKDVGFVGWRFDFVRGYAPEYCKE
jgi:glycosidase